MIDLNKLEAKFDKFFEEETEESFSAWLFDKLMEESLSKLSNNDWMDFSFFNEPDKLSIKPISKFSNETNPTVPINIQYTMAA